MIYYNEMSERYPLSNPDYEFFVGQACIKQWFNVDTKGLILEHVYGYLYRYKTEPGNFHRWDGPALISHHDLSWIWNGKDVARATYVGDNKFEFNFESIDNLSRFRWCQQQNIDLFNLSEDDIDFIKLVWG